MVADEPDLFRFFVQFVIPFSWLGHLSFSLLLKANASKLKAKIILNSYSDNF